MTTRTTPWPAGVPCWTDLSVRDLEAAKTFYSRVVGWTFEQQGEEYGGYAIAQAGGRAAAGVGPAQGDAPVAWTMYFATDDADAVAARVVAAGGRVLLAPGDVGPLGRMAVAADPTGAVFGVWQAGRHIGSEVAGEPGALAWEDLRSADPKAAVAFYGEVFGLESVPFEAAGPDYWTFMLPGDPAPLGGMGGMMGQEGIGSHWTVYFAVADVDAAVAAVRAGGGTVHSDAFDTSFGRMAPVADPEGATFWLYAPPEGAPVPER